MSLLINVHTLIVPARANADETLKIISVASSSSYNILVWHINFN